MPRKNGNKKMAKQNAKAKKPKCNLSNLKKAMMG
jgi:hypothetical protein